MKIYTVHQPPARRRQTRRGPERFRFVRDGFHFWAFLLPPLWMLRRGLVLVLLGYVVLAAALNAGLYFAGVAPFARVLANLALGFLVGLEASSLRRWTLRRRGWTELGVIAAPDQEAAERRFFDQWTAREGAPPPSSGPQQPPVFRRPPAEEPVIGLFPEPGAAR